jgi:hypothetical protein
MKKTAHNTYIENLAWNEMKEASRKHPDALSNELVKHPTGSSSAYAAMLSKVGLLLDSPGLIHTTQIDWASAIKFAKKHNLPLSKYISSLT